MNMTLRRTHTDYNLNSTYTNLRIIGLPAAKYVCDGTQGATPCNDYSGSSLFSKVSFFYDEGSVSYQGYTVQHDDSNYGTGFLAGRGNLTTMRRYNVPSLSSSTTNSATYNTAGSVISATDASGHASNISYSDSYSDSTNHSTLAYPTTLTDADNYSSYVQYNYDFGAKTRVQGPPPQNQSQGAIQTITYDTAARVDRVTTTYNGAYTRYVYGPYYTQTWSTVNNVADEAYNFQIFDGVGHVYGVAGYHPGSSGGYKGKMTVYNAMGRAIKQSNPTEMTPSWQAYGDDSAGWYYTQQTYDWKGRPLVTTNTDGTTKTASYTGCGCAGGEMITLTDEGTIDAGQAKKRQQKIYHDVLGRAIKTEVLSWENGSVYSTAVNTYNVRDQVTNIKQWAGVENGGGASQDTSMTYDGYGRLLTKHVPEQQDSNGNPTHTTWAYNPDDTVLTITDARGAVATYSYNNRHLVTSVSNALSGLSTINVTYGYDAVGNRTSMNHLIDGAAKDSATYNYDQLSRMTSETRHINALEGYGPNYGNFTISYGYTVSSELQSVTDPFSSTTNLSYDVAGRTSTVSGSYGGTNYTYAGSVGYRAWDAVKSASFGNNASETVSYNSRMQPTQFRSTPGQGVNQMRYDYSYYNDSRLKQITDLDDQVGDPHYVQFHYMSRAYQYDQSARTSGVTAQSPNPNNVPAPFTGSYGFDAFNNMNSRTGQYALNSNESDSGTYSNNRRSGWNYDADGRVTTSSDNSDSGGGSTRTWTYDAAGEEVTVSEVRNGQTTTNTLAYDGDGDLLYESVSGGASDYPIRSAVLGTVLTKLDASGNKDTTYVPANGLLMPLQQKDYQGNPTMSWVHRDALGLQENGKAYDPFGNLIFNVQPPVVPPPPYVPFYGATYGGASWNSFINANNFGVGCKLDGVSKPCSSVLGAIGSGQVGAVTFSTTGGPADFANLGIFVTISPAQTAPKTKPTLKPSMTPNPNPENPNPYNIGADEGLQYLINISFSSDLLEPQNSPSTPCHIMADVAQNEANDALGQNPHDDRAALGVFDKRFSTLYVGGPAYDSYHAYRLRSGDQRTINGQYPITGGDGFRNEYKDSGYDPNPLIAGPKADQTHHFAMYLSLGINKVTWATGYGIWREDNQGDINLSGAAYRMGIQLHNRPSMLNRIGSWIRRTICDGPGHGLYY